MEKLKIVNFGGLKSVEFEFNGINILIGEQGSGKSITAKLMYFFKTFFVEAIKSVQDQKVLNQFKGYLLNRFQTFFPMHAWPAGDFYLKYSYGDTFQCVKRFEGALSLEWSENWSQAYNEAGTALNIRFLRSASTTTTTTVPPPNAIDIHRLSQLAAAVFNKHLPVQLGYNQYYIPAGRSFFATIQTTFYSFVSDNRSLDPFFAAFGQEYEYFKHYYLNYIVNSQVEYKEVDKLIEGVLHSKFYRENGQDYLLHSDNRKVNIGNASSGQQEMLPIALFLLCFNATSTQNFSLYIEEPEAHIFPSAQKSIVALLARTFNMGQGNIQITATTHSPYLLTSINNLLEAGRLTQLRPEDATSIEEIVPLQEQIKPGAVAAYALQKGAIVSLIDEESKLISAAIIDEVSNEIAIDFGKLLDIEY